MARYLQHGCWSTITCSQRRALAAYFSLVLIGGLSLILGGAPNASAKNTGSPQLSVLGDGSLIPGWGPSGGAVLVTFRPSTSPTSTRSAQSVARFVVRDTSGRRIRTLRPITVPGATAGARSTMWNGFTDAGLEAPAGSYRVAGLNARGKTVATGKVTVKASPLRISGLKLSSGGLGRSASRRQVRASFGLTQTSSVAAVVVDRNGFVVKQLVGGRVRKGRPSLRWNGKTSSGAQAPDGMYELVVVAQGSGAPTSTVRAPVRVDVNAPTLKTPEQVAARLNNGLATFTFEATTSEPGALRIRTDNGRTATRQLRASGSQQITIRATELGLSPTATARSVGAQVTLTDSVGNAISNRLTLTVPAVAKPNPDGGGGSLPPSSPVGTSGMRWPSSGPVTSLYGPRWGRMHQGIDIGSPNGSPIVAVKDGTVTFAGSQSGYGNIVVVDHGGGVHTAYAHQSKLAAVVGQRVARGQVIGYVGSTGHSFGPHLHFEIRINGVAVNPLPYLPGNRKMMLSSTDEHDHDTVSIKGAEQSAI